MNDVLPADIAGLAAPRERSRASCSRRTRYQEIRVPIVEHTALFKRSIGEFTDIVQKEMFTFEDPGGESLTLRPEATAGIVRAMITQRPAAQSAPARLVCGADVPPREAAARPLPPVLSARRRSVRLSPGPDIDAELIMLSARLLQRAGRANESSCNLNSLGTPDVAHARIAKSWSSYFSAHKSQARRRQPATPRRQSAAHSRQQESGAAGHHRRRAAADRVSRRGIAPALRRPAPSSRRGRHHVRAQSAPGARPRLLLAHGVRVADDRARLAGRGLFGRPLRWPGHAAGRRAHAGDRLGAGPGAHRRAAARAERRTPAQVRRTSISSIAGRARRGRGPGAGRTLRDALPSAAHRDELRRRQLQVAAEARRQERRRIWR